MLVDRDIIMFLILFGNFGGGIWQVEVRLDSLQRSRHQNRYVHGSHAELNHLLCNVDIP